MSRFCARCIKQRPNPYVALPITQHNNRIEEFARAYEYDHNEREITHKISLFLDTSAHDARHDSDVIPLTSQTDCRLSALSDDLAHTHETSARRGSMRSSSSILRHSLSSSAVASVGLGKHGQAALRRVDCAAGGYREE
jgi:hypothetical protein